MSDPRLIITDINSITGNEENTMSGTNIKEEMVNDDDILLFTTTELEEFSRDSNNFQIANEILNNSDSIPNNATFNIPTLDEAQINQLLTTENYVRFPIDLGQICKFEAIKYNNVSHYIKYKFQDGKHNKIWECGMCAKEFGHQYTLMRHLPTHTDERKFQCNICGKAFRQMSTLSQHRAIHSAERPYVCEVCQKTFNRVSTLISHRKTHTGLKPHRCHLCNKAFHQKGNLRNHIFTHTNERPYKCDICAKGFNQMSNLMCHKVKAHQRADKPRYICQICGKDFQKRMGLRNHEQYQHGVQNLDSSTSTATSSRVKYTNGVLVDPINTTAMQHALQTNQTPFALLRPMNGIPVLVRVLTAGDKQMLVPATAEDLKKHGQITITPQLDEETKKEEVTDDPLNTENKKENKLNDEQTAAAKPIGSTVQIKIPVVATVVQRCNKDGNVCMAVESPGPSTDSTVNDSCIISATVNGNSLGEAAGANFNAIYENSTENYLKDTQIQSSTHVQYIDEHGNLLAENDFKTKEEFLAGTFQSESENIFSKNFQLKNNLINLQDHESILKGIDTENVMNISYFEEAADPIFEILEKPQVISLNETDSILETSNIIYDATMNTNFVLP